MKQARGTFFWVLAMGCIGSLIMVGYGAYHGEFTRFASSFGVVALICGGLCLLYLMGKKLSQNYFEKATEHKEHAKVISKTSQVSGNSLGVNTVHFVTFEFLDKSRKGFEVDSIQYGLIVEGESGFLTYRQHETLLFFVDFQLHPQ